MYVLFAVGMLSLLVLGQWAWRRREEARERDLWRHEHLPENVLPFRAARTREDRATAPAPPAGSGSVLPFPTDPSVPPGRRSRLGDGLRPR